jgi:hypothetical protein
MESTVPAEHAPLSSLLVRLRDVLQAQAEALGADDFSGLEGLSIERDRLVAALGPYTAAQVTPDERKVLDQIGALDQRLMEQVRSSQQQARHDLGDVRRGRTALNEYRRRGQNVIPGLPRLDFER